MVDDETIARIVAAAPSLSEGAGRLVDAANAAGGRDNITVVLFRLAEAEAEAGVDGQATARHDLAEQDTSAGDAVGAEAVRAAVAEAERPEPVVARSPRPAPPEGRRRRAPRLRRGVKIALIVLAILVPVLVGGWVATRAVYFVGTDSRGIVTIYRGVPYELPAGLKLYETFYQSGVPASSVPAARRDKLLDHSLRSQRDATDLVDQLELGRLEANP
jgi:protein phosphatase